MPASDTLSRVNTMLKRHGKYMTPSQVCQFVSELQTLSDAPESAEFRKSASDLNRVVSRVVLNLQKEQIRSLVLKREIAWMNSRYQEDFASSFARLLVGNWKRQEAFGSSQSIRVWIEDGWKLLKGDLESPWGVCETEGCNNTLVPLRYTNAKGVRVVRIFDTCPVCHHKELRK